jgi:4'-phosphopantetheinyl transferase
MGLAASDVAQGEDLLPRQSVWIRCENPPVLEKNGLHIWRLFMPELPRVQATPAPFLEINDAPPRLERFGAWLSPDERERAARYHFDADRRRFAWTRGVLRALLASYVGCAPSRIHFGAGEKGKLYLSPATEGLPEGLQGGLRFNVSHSHEWALIALTRDRDVGVDVEYHRPLRHDLFGIATRFFAPAEVAALRALSPAEQEPAFFRIWSRKEAYIKATGEGVSAGLDTFEVSIGQETAVRLRVYDRPAENTRWRMQSLDVGPDYGAALCIEGHDVELKLWEW